MRRLLGFSTSAIFTLSLSQMTTITEERLCEKAARLFNLGDFLYSSFFGLLPSLVDIGTDFSFAARLRWKIER